MKALIPIISNEAPSQKNALWIKPVAGGFALYVMDGNKWLAQKQMDDNGTSKTTDDTVQNLVGKAQDSKTKNTIYGAKNYAKDQADALMGTESDTAEEMTLYGLKAYIDAQIAGIE